MLECGGVRVPVCYVCMFACVSEKQPALVWELGGPPTPPSPVSLCKSLGVSEIAACPQGGLFCAVGQRETEGTREADGPLNAGPS